MKAPSKNPITLPFGATTSPYTPSNSHKGTDFSYLPDNKIYAPFSGKVTQIPNNGNDGNGTYMTDSQGRFHGLLHASKYLVPNGSNVKEGQAVAVMGETGYAFGAHLHWAVKQNGKFINPMSLVKGDSMTPQQKADAALGRKAREDKYQARIKAMQKATLVEIKANLNDPNFVAEVRKLVK